MVFEECVLCGIARGIRTHSFRKRSHHKGLRNISTVLVNHPKRIDLPKLAVEVNEEKYKGLVKMIKSFGIVLLLDLAFGTI